MGSVISSQMGSVMDENMKKQQDFMVKNQQIMMERTIVMQVTLWHDNTGELTMSKNDLRELGKMKNTYIHTHQQT